MFVAGLNFYCRSQDPEDVAMKATKVEMRALKRLGGDDGCNNDES